MTTHAYSSFNKGNFKALLAFRVDAGDELLEDHLKKCKKNASYPSKTSQNDLLLCIKKYIPDEIVSEVNQQRVGPYYGIQCDEVTDSSNWEQLGLVLRYVKDGKPIERLLEFSQCSSAKGEDLCQSIIESLTEAGLEPDHYRSQTMDGAGNMAGCNKGCAANFNKVAPRALYHYCCSHDLNLALCKSCNVKEIHYMLESLKQLGIFFKYSPKRSRRLEEAIREVNGRRPKAEQIEKTKFKVFCETRWVEKHNTLQDFDDLYEPLLTLFMSCLCPRPRLELSRLSLFLLPPRPPCLPPRPLPRPPPPPLPLFIILGCTLGSVMGEG